MKGGKNRIAQSVTELGEEWHCDWGKASGTPKGGNSKLKEYLKPSDSLLRQTAGQAGSQQISNVTYVHVFHSTDT